jgi:diguanylate cyclase (GGDEF)-like protein
LSAAASADALVAAAYAAVRPLADGARDGQPLATAFTGADGQRVQVGFARLADEAGLDWLIIVAVPRHEFLAGIERNVGHAALGTALAATLALGIGLAVLAVVRRELRRLSEATQRLADGQPGPLLRTDRRDELGDLARRFDDMQTRLLTDPLTGLSNREALLRRAGERIRQHRRRDDLQPFALLFADLNRFKQINDRFGHDVGDAVLRELAQRLRTGVRTTDLVARWAGDEFVLLVESARSRPDADAVRAHLEAELRRPLEALAGVAAVEANAGTTADDASAGAAIGVAVYPDDGPDVQALLKHADEDMYRRKEQR